jgi:hypothetical protein
MPNTHGHWVSELIKANLDELATEAVTLAQAQVTLYSRLSTEVVKDMFTTTYRALADTLDSGSIEPMRAHMEVVIPSRIQSGASAESLIALATLLEGTVHRLILREQPDPLVAAEASRSLMAQTKNARLILTGINLRLLTQRRPY